MARRSKGPVFTPLEKKSIWSLSAILFFRMMGLFLVLPIFSIYAKDFEHQTPALIGFAFGAYGLTQALFQIPFGIWSDKYGRKPVIALGLVLFILGSVLCALTQNIYVMILGRLLQGVGAISSAVFALIADLTRPEVRARANAGLGSSIGMSFGLSFMCAPFLASWIGLNGVFWIIAIVSFISLVLLYTWVPEPEKQVREEPKSHWAMIKIVLLLPHLRVINLGAFICNMALTAMFFSTPLILSEHGFARSESWKVYLPMLLFGGVTMVMAAILAEVKNKFRQVMLGGAAMLIVSFLFTWAGEVQSSLTLYLIGVFVFFMGFNVFEPIFPSLVTRMTTPSTKGTASGINNFAQFMGNFAGAALAGLFYKSHPEILTVILCLGGATFFYLTLSFPNPVKHEKPVEAKEPTITSETSTVSAQS